MATGAKYVTADEAMVIAARAMNAIESPVKDADARTIYTAAASLVAVNPEIQVPVPDYLYNDFGRDILSRRDA